MGSSHQDAGCAFSGSSHIWVPALVVASLWAVGMCVRQGCKRVERGTQFSHQFLCLDCPAREEAVTVLPPQNQSAFGGIKICWQWKPLGFHSHLVLSNCATQSSHMHCKENLKYVCLVVLADYWGRKGTFSFLRNLRDSGDCIDRDEGVCLHSVHLLHQLWQLLFVGLSVKWLLHKLVLSVLF